MTTMKSWDQVGEQFIDPRDKQNPSKPDLENEGKFADFTAKPENIKEENDKWT